MLRRWTLRRLGATGGRGWAWPSANRCRSFTLYHFNIFIVYYRLSYLQDASRACNCQQACTQEIVGGRDGGREEGSHRHSAPKRSLRDMNCAFLDCLSNPFGIAISFSMELSCQAWPQHAHCEVELRRTGCRPPPRPRLLPTAIAGPACWRYETRDVLDGRRQFDCTSAAPFLR